MLGLCCCTGFSLVSERGDCSLVAGCGLLTAVASLVEEKGLWSTGSVVVAHGFSCSVACGVMPDQGSNLCPLCWKVDSSHLSHQGSPTVTVVTWPHHTR